MTSFTKISCTSHPLRQTLYNELHTRPFHAISAPRQISYLSIAARHQDQDRALELLRQLCSRYQRPQPDSKTTGFRENFGDFTLEWDRHGEFYSLTISHPVATDADPFAVPAIERLPGDWLAELPGEVVAAFHIAVTSGNDAAEPGDLSRYFEGQHISISAAKQGKACIYTAFRLHADGFGRFIIVNKSMSDAQLGRLTRRLIEVETYRLFAMLPLPQAKKIVPQLGEMDRQLARLLSELPQIGTNEDERNLLQKLSELEARLESWRAETNHRFSGAKAYHELVQDRLGRIGEEKVEGYTTLGEFMRRRLDPAMRTCASVQTWMDDLSQRIERASDLMRTRANLTLQEQNRSLLAAMNRRSRLQFRLQETVEGLSVVAISYYLVSLINYMLYALPLKTWGLSKPVVTAAAIPLVLGGVLWLTRRIKHRLIQAPDHEEGEQ
ncbi:MAG: DUF3422 domain-containing protein [Desulfuromonas sp.]|nr:MAG: DUF3422 domain-containing protein [Desulfuromonas sp.]